MAFTKTSAPYWTIDDTPANVAAEFKVEMIEPHEVMTACPSNTAGKIFVIVKRGIYR